MAARRWFVGLGSDLDPENHLQQALFHLRRVGVLEALSTFRWTAPADGIQGPLFLNGVAALRPNDPQAEPRPLLKELEAVVGGAPGGPRAVDLDLLWVTPGGTTDVHPDVRRRSFVAQALAEVLAPFDRLRLPSLDPSAAPTSSRPADEFTSKVRERFLNGPLSRTVLSQSVWTLDY